MKGYSLLLQLDVENFGQITDEIGKHKLSYHTFTNLHLLHPAPQVRYLKNWLDTSLDIDFGLILADLILSEQIKINKTKINNVIAFLNNTIIRYGAYSIFTGFWQPAKSDSSIPVINKMEILAATIGFDNGIYYKTSKKEMELILKN